MLAIAADDLQIRRHGVLDVPSLLLDGGDQEVRVDGCVTGSLFRDDTF